LAVTIRLKKTGTKNRDQWRIVVATSEVPRNGRLLEEIGFYNPLVEPPLVQVKMDRYQAWVSKGARPSEAVRHLMTGELGRARAH